MTRHLVGMTEIAEMLGVSPQRAHQLSLAYVDFPEPEVELAAGRIWKRTAVERWMKAHPARKPGRPASQDSKG
jgi:prophage regulatory protein